MAESARAPHPPRPTNSARDATVSHRPPRRTILASAIGLGGALLDARLTGADAGIRTLRLSAAQVLSGAAETAPDLPPQPSPGWPGQSATSPYQPGSPAGGTRPPYQPARPPNLTDTGPSLVQPTPAPNLPGQPDQPAQPMGSGPSSGTAPATEPATPGAAPGAPVTGGAPVTSQPGSPAPASPGGGHRDSDGQASDAGTPNSPARDGEPPAAGGTRVSPAVPVAAEAAPSGNVADRSRPVASTATTSSARPPVVVPAAMPRTGAGGNHSRPRP